MAYPGGLFALRAHPFGFALWAFSAACRLIVRQGFDLLVSDLVARAAEELSLIKSAPEGIRTPDPVVRSQVLYPPELLRESVVSESLRSRIGQSTRISRGSAKQDTTPR
jgi:hypothetical protein